MFGQRSVPVWVQDRRTGARLRLGVRYPLRYGGTAEVVRARLPGLRGTAVLVRIDAPGQLASYRWIPGRLVGQTIIFDFPTMDVGRIFSQVWSRGQP